VQTIQFMTSLTKNWFVGEFSWLPLGSSQFYYYQWPLASMLITAFIFEKKGPSECRLHNNNFFFSFYIVVVHPVSLSWHH